MANSPASPTPPECCCFSIWLAEPVSMRLSTVVLVAALAGAWIGVSAYGQADRPVVAQDAAVAQERDRIPREVLLKALLVPEHKFEIANRAAQQLALLPPDESSSATVVRNVVERLNRKQTGRVGRLAAPSFVDAIAAQGRFAVPELVRALQEGSHSDEASVTILASLGRIGPAAAEAQVALHTVLKTHSTDPRSRKTILVVLANIGDRSDGLVEQIRADFDDSNKDAAWRDGYYLWVMSMMRPRGDWVDGRLLASLSPLLVEPKYLENRLFFAMRAAAVLGLAELNAEESRPIKRP
jgi:hypothetical protein